MRSSKKSDALTYFNYAGGTKKLPKEVSEFTRAARRCGEAMKGGFLTIQKEAVKFQRARAWE